MINKESNSEDLTRTETNKGAESLWGANESVTVTD